MRRPCLRAHKGVVPIVGHVRDRAPHQLGGPQDPRARAHLAGLWNFGPAFWIVPLFLVLPSVAVVPVFWIIPAFGIVVFPVVVCRRWHAACLPNTAHIWSCSDCSGVPVFWNVPVIWVVPAFWISLTIPKLNMPTCPCDSPRWKVRVQTATGQATAQCARAHTHKSTGLKSCLHQRHRHLSLLPWPMSFFPMR